MLSTHYTGMDTIDLTEWAARSVLAGLLGSAAAGAALNRQPLRGGSEAAETTLFSARYGQSSEKTLRFMVKRLSGRPAREAAIYEGLVRRYAGRLGPALLGVYRRDQSLLLVLEAIPRRSAWPWRDNATTAALLSELGQFHANICQRDVELPEWDYESELAASGQVAINLLEQCRRVEDLRPLARHRGTVERVVEAMPRLRRRLLDEAPFERRPIHGDVHSGNAVIRSGAKARPVLLDWGRARLGSPLEDVSSILQSLRHWEPAAMTRHDHLMKHHLSGLGQDRKLTDPLRSAYWVAGASNALAGALTVHLMAALDETSPAANRKAALGMAGNSLWVIRRAHAWALN